MRLAVCLAAAVAMSSLPAFADLNATFTEGSTTLNFSLPNTSVSVGEDFKAIYEIGVSSINGKPTDAELVFSSSPGFGLNFGVSPDLLQQDPGNYFYGPYPGLNGTDPTTGYYVLTLLPGTYNYTAFSYYTENSIPATLTLTTPTPEPSTLALLGSGALGAFGVLRRRLTV